MKDEGAAVPVFNTTSVARQRAESGRSYLEFLRVPAMSGGLYVLPAGAEDVQQPHTEDEVYVVVRGRGRFRVGYEDFPAAAGLIFYVPANLEHRFHSIEEELEVLVFFAPAEYANKP